MIAFAPFLLLFGGAFVALIGYFKLTDPRLRYFAQRQQVERRELHRGFAALVGGFLCVVASILLVLFRR